ncbi:hypothetical protein Tco_1126405, partial [Tanacetum coccineum]
VNPEVSTATTKANTASTEICTASFSDVIVYAFLSTQPKESQLVYEDLEQLHDDWSGYSRKGQKESQKQAIPSTE